MAAAPAVEENLLPYPLASALRWVALAAGREQVASLLDSSSVHDHLLSLQSLDKLPDEVAASLDEASAIAETAAPDKALGKATIEAVAKTAAQAVLEVSSGSVSMEVERLTASPALLNMAKHLGLYWWFAAQKQQEPALRNLSLGLQECRRCHWGQPPWRGANLGGWLLLEPGPASPFFENCQAKMDEVNGSTSPAEQGRENPPGLDDEHALCRALEAAGGVQLKKDLFRSHRATHYDEKTFNKIADCGLNAVRLPFGHWVVDTPAQGEAYEGPCLEVLDRAVELANARGLQVLLDLHGNPGGESGDRPCGKKDSEWTWQHWRQDRAVELLGLLATRFRDASCVTGMQVCNEPSEGIPTEVLCTFYERAIKAIRDGGMGPERVAVVLPVFTQLRLPQIVGCWHARGNFLKFDNVAFDLHYYHNFSSIWNLLSQAQHLQVTADNARDLKLLPGAVVGEWSLSRPGTWTDDEKAEFAVHQVLAYNHASHGWFFWNWHDHDFYPDWDFERGVLDCGKLPCPLGARELKGVLFPEWEADPSSVPNRPLPGAWPRMISWATWLRGLVVS